MLTGLTGDALEHGRSMDFEDFVAADCVDRLMARLEDRFGASPGSSVVAGFSALHASSRGGRSMSSFLVAFEKAASMLHDAGMAMADDHQAYLVHSLAGLSEHELAMAMTSATSGSTAAITYRRMARTLMDLFGRKGTASTSALVVQTSPGRGGAGLRPPSRAGGSAYGGSGHRGRGGPDLTGDPLMCWYL